MENLVLKNVKIIFANLEEEKGFAPSLTLDVTDETTQKTITDWYATNKVAKGTPNFKEYTNKEGETVVQWNVKLSKFTQFGGANGENETNKGLTYGAVINVNVRPYEYSNKFGAGVSCSLSAVYVVTPAVKSALAEISE